MVPVTPVRSATSPDLKRNSAPRGHLSQELKPEELYLVKYSSLLCTLAHNVMRYVERNEKAPQDFYKDLQCNLLGRNDLKEKGEGVVRLATQAHRFVLEKRQGHLEREIPAEALRNRFLVLKQDLEILEEGEEELRLLQRPTRKPSEEETKEEVPKSEEETEEFVEMFNRSHQQRSVNRKLALKKLEELREQVGLGEQYQTSGIVIEEVNVVRNAFFLLFECEDPEVKERVLENLIELLEKDPLVMESAFDLVKLQQRLLEKIQANNVQNLNTHLQRLLIRAYAICLECILLQAGAGNLNALTDTTKQEIWAGAEVLKSCNVVEDREINFWTHYAIQGAQHITTNVGKAEEWLTRLALISRAGLRIVAAIYKPEEVANAADGVVSDLKQAFWHIERHRDWFRQALLLKKLCRYSLHNPEEFHKAVVVVQGYKVQRHRKGDEEDFLLYYSIISTIEYAILNARPSEVQEEGIKLLLQYFTMNQAEIRERVIQAFCALTKGNVYLRETAFVLLKLIQANPSIPTTDHPLLNRTLVDMESKNEKLTHVYPNVVKFMIRRFAEIKGELDYGGHSLVTLLSSASNDAATLAFLECIASLAPEFQQPDIYGQTPYHILATLKNVSMIRFVHQKLNIDINARAYEDQNTALHYGTKAQCFEVVSLLLDLGADPNIRNKEGKTALHEAVITDNFSIVERLVHSETRLDLRDNQGKTALDWAIKKDRVQLAALLLKNQAKVSGDVHQLSPLILAAREGAEETLMFLIEGAQGKISHLEALEICRLISKNGLDVTCSQKFAQFHYNMQQQSKDYKRAFKYFKRWPQVQVEEDLTISLRGTRKIGVMTRQETIRKLEKSGDLKDTGLDEFGNPYVSRLSREVLTLEKLKEVVTNKELLNQTNFLGLNALHVAIVYRNRDALEVLLQAGAQCDVQDSRGNTPLHLAAYMRDDVAVELLLKAGANPNLKNDYGDTPLLIFCGNSPERAPETIYTVINRFDVLVPTVNDPKIMMLLTEAKADPLAVDKLGNNLLHHAAVHGCPAVIAHSCRTYPDLFWKENHLGFLPVEMAVQRREGYDLDVILQYAGGEELVALHKTFIEKTKNRVNLGILLSMANCASIFWKLIELVPEAATHVDGSAMKETPLHRAARMGHLEIVRVYVKKGLDLNQKDAFGNTAAHLAAYGEHVEVLRELIENDADLNLRNSDGWNPLHMAAMKKNSEAVKLLLEREPKLALQKDGHGDTPVHLASKEGRLDNVRVMCGNMPELKECINDDGNTPLHLAAGRGYLKLVKYFAEEDVYLDARNIFGATPLVLAAKQGKQEVLKFLIEQGANIRAQDDEGETALHKAVFNLHAEAVDCLLEKDHELFCPKELKLVNIPDLSQEYPLHEVTKHMMKDLDIQNRRIEITKKLLAAGANPNKRDERGETFVHLVCYYGLDELLGFLIDYAKSKEKRHDIHFKKGDASGNGLLHKAAEGNQEHLLRTLLKLGVNLNRRNVNGWTPLQVAAMKGYSKVAFELIRLRADLESKDEEGKNILHLILSQEKVSDEGLEILKKLVVKRPKLILEKDKHRNTPLHYLAEKNHLAALDLLLQYLPGTPQDNQKYVWRKNKEGSNANDIAATKKNLELERRIRTYPKEQLGSAYIRRRGFLRARDTLLGKFGGHRNSELTVTESDDVS